MKTKTFLSLLAATLLTFTVAGQNVPGAGVEKPKKEITFSTQQEKDARIKALKEKIKIDSIDATFPSDVLKKEKEELAETKKARISGTKNETLKNN